MAYAQRISRRRRTEREILRQPSEKIIANRMHAKRRQLSMYVPADAASGIEAVRRVLDPVQSA